MSTVNIPRLDLNDYINGSAADRKQFSDKIGEAFNQTGFVTITNHGLSKQLIDDLYNQVKTLFALPDDVKQNMRSLAWPGSGDIPVKEKKPPRASKPPI